MPTSTGNANQNPPQRYGLQPLTKPHKQTNTLSQTTLTDLTNTNTRKTSHKHNIPLHPKQTLNTNFFFDK
jgi:hypothetical protein